MVSEKKIEEAIKECEDLILRNDIDAIKSYEEGIVNALKWVLNGGILDL